MVIYIPNDTAQPLLDLLTEAVRIDSGTLNTMAGEVAIAAIKREMAGYPYQVYLKGRPRPLQSWPPEEDD